MHRLLLFSLICSLCACASPGPEPRERVAEASASAGLLGNPRFADFDPHPWEGRGPNSYAIHGLDVARFQEEIDWRTARRAGISFAFIKATEGGDLRDPMFDKHWDGARRAGVRRGAYHFYYFCRPAEEQAQWFIENVPRNRSDLPHVLDMEWNPFSPTCTFRPEGVVVRSEADKFLDILQRHYGKRPIVYTTPDFYRQTGIGRLRGTEFWLRSVAAHPSEIYEGQPWRFWQYTGTGQVPGVSGPVDINVFSGTAAEWARWSN